MRIQRKHRLDRNVHPLKPVLLEHNLCHALPVRLGVHRGLGEEDLATAGVDVQLLVERVVPEDLHVVPVAHDAMLHRMGDLEVVPVLLRFVADHEVFDHGGGLALFGTEDGAADYGGEDWGGS